MIHKKVIVFFLFLLIPTWMFAEDSLFLKENLRKAMPGDFIVFSAGRAYTLMSIRAKQDNLLTIEEVVIPESKREAQSMSWREWIRNNAPENTSWVMYEIDLSNGQMTRYYSFTKHDWFQIPDADNFLSKLLNLQLNKTPPNMRKKVGPKPSDGPDMRPLWQPRMIIDGKPIQGVAFDAWYTQWPRDGSDLSNKRIDIYLPRESQRYPAYFPYWLQVTGAVGKAKIRIVDSGSHLESPKPSLSTISPPAS